MNEWFALRSVGEWFALRSVGEMACLILTIGLAAGWIISAVRGDGE